jgi:hypothetical protein
MPNSKTITINEQFNLSSGELIIKSIAGDAHVTTHRIYYKNTLIKNGEGIVIGNTLANSGEEIFIEATINMPEGSSEYASLSLEINDNVNTDNWNYSSQETDCDEVIYEVTITLE